jgi:hypothetical protein
MKKKTNLFARTAMTLLLAVLCSSGAWAQEKAKGIVIWLNDGNQSKVLFADMPELTYADGMVSLTTSSPSTTLSWPIETVQKMTFEDVETAIRDVKATGLDLLSDQFDAYDLGGKLIRKDVKSISELPLGTYIIKDGSTTIKVQRK